MTLRDKFKEMSPEEQELQILQSMTHIDGIDREWFAVELREAFDRVLAKGWIAPSAAYYITFEGRAHLLAQPMDEAAG